jgi:hypothetical protein
MSMVGVGLGLAGAAALGKGISAWGKARGAISEEEEERLKELERMEAINMLGGDYNVALGKHLTPVQGAMREAREQVSQDISAQDLTSGSYFRGQQAMTEAAGKQRAAAEQRAQEEMMRTEEIRRAELAMLREKQRIADNAMWIALDEAAGMGGEVGTGLTDIGIQKERMAQLEKMAEADAEKAKSAFRAYRFNVKGKE